MEARFVRVEVLARWKLQIKGKSDHGVDKTLLELQHVCQENIYGQGSPRHCGRQETHMVMMFLPLVYYLGVTYYEGLQVKLQIYEIHVLMVEYLDTG